MCIFQMFALHTLKGPLKGPLNGSLKINVFTVFRKYKDSTDNVSIDIMLKLSFNQSF